MSSRMLGRRVAALLPSKTSLINKSFCRQLSSNASRTNQLLEEVRQSFPDTQDLHPRVDLILNNPSKVVRVALIPFHVHRNSVKGVLDAVLADPLSSNLEWYDAFVNRLLGKNTLVKYNPTFDKNIITHNSLVEYAVPFSVPTTETNSLRGITDPRQVEIIEVNSYKDSLDHLKQCHRHVYLCDDARTAYTKPLTSYYPSEMYLDLAQSKDLGASTVSSKVQIISSETANKGNQMFRESPSNVSEYLELLKQSNIEAVQHSVFGHSLEDAEHAVLKTIAQTCEEIVDKEEEVTYDISTETVSVTRRREQWATEAHTELQTTFTKALDELIQNRLAWWKLYYKVDDVFQAASETLIYYFMPRTQDRFEYLLGRIDQFAEEHYFPPLPKSEQDTAGQISKTEDISAMFKKSRDSMISELAVDLHNAALRELLKNLLGVQVPLIVLPLLGVYLFDYSLYGAGSIMALGVAVGASRLQKAWQRATTKFKSAALEKAKVTVEQCERGIWQRWEAQVKNQKKASESRRRLIDELKENTTTR